MARPKRNAYQDWEAQAAADPAQSAPANAYEAWEQESTAVPPQEITPPEQAVPGAEAMLATRERLAPISEAIPGPPQAAPISATMRPGRHRERVEEIEEIERERREKPDLAGDIWRFPGRVVTAPLEATAQAAQYVGRKYDVPGLERAGKFVRGAGQMALYRTPLGLPMLAGSLLGGITDVIQGVPGSGAETGKSAAYLIGLKVIPVVAGAIAKRFGVSPEAAQAVAGKVVTAALMGSSGVSGLTEEYERTGSISKAALEGLLSAAEVGVGLWAGGKAVKAVGAAEQRRGVVKREGIKLRAKGEREMRAYQAAEAKAAPRRPEPPRGPRRAAEISLRAERKAAAPRLRAERVGELAELKATQLVDEARAATQARRRTAAARARIGRPKALARAIRAPQPPAEGLRPEVAAGEVGPPAAVGPGAYAVGAAAPKPAAKAVGKAQPKPTAPKEAWRARPMKEWAPRARRAIDIGEAIGAKMREVGEPSKLGPQIRGLAGKEVTAARPEPVLGPPKAKPAPKVPLTPVAKVIVKTAATIEKLAAKPKLSSTEKSFLGMVAASKTPDAARAREVLGIAPPKAPPGKVGPPPTNAPVAKGEKRMPHERYRAIGPDGKTVEMHAGIAVPGYEGVSEDIAAAAKAAGRAIKAVVRPPVKVKPGEPAPPMRGNIVQQTRDAAIKALAGTRVGKQLSVARQRLLRGAKAAEVAVVGAAPKEALAEAPGGSRALADIAGQPQVERRFWEAAINLSKKVEGLIGKGPESRRAMEVLEGTRPASSIPRLAQRKVKQARRFYNHLETLMVDTGLMDEATVMQRHGTYIKPTFKEFDEPGMIQKFRNLWNRRTLKMSKQYRRKYEKLAEYEKIGLHPKEEVGYTLLKDWAKKGTDISKGLAIKDIAGIETLVYEPTVTHKTHKIPIPKKTQHVVINQATGKTVRRYGNSADARRYMSDHPKQSLRVEKQPAIRYRTETIVGKPPVGQEDWMRVPDAKEWGALRGKFVHPDLHAVLTGEGYGPAIKEAGTAAGRWISRQRKSTATYRNIPRHIRQYMENTFALDLNADIDPVTGFRKHYLAGAKEIATNSKMWQRFKAQSGLVDTDYWAQMIRRTRAVKATNFAQLNKALSGAYSGGGRLVRAYRFGDTYFKYLAWRKIILEGGTNQQAIRSANDSIVNFENVPPKIRAAERAWYGPMFMSARYVAARNALRAATTPRGMLKLAKYAAIGSGISYYSMKALGLTAKDIEEIKRAKHIGAVSVLLPWTYNGEPQFLDLTHLWGGGEEYDLVAAMAKLNGEDVGQAVKDYSKQVVGSAPMFSMLLEAKTGKDSFTGQWVYTPGVGLVRQTAEYTAAQAKKLFVPWYMQRAGEAARGGEPLRPAKDILGLPMRGVKPHEARKTLRRRKRKRELGERRPFLGLQPRKKQVGLGPPRR